MPRVLFFPYFGPSRRSDKRVIEIKLDFGPLDSSGFPQQVSSVRQLLLDAGVLEAEERYPDEPLPDDRMAWYSSLLAQTALLFQRKNGHRVGFFSVACNPDKCRCTALVEHEHSKVAMTAVKLAVELFSGKLNSLAEAYCSFSEYARDNRLPLETEAIINAARRRDIPVFQLERDPLTGRFDTGFRVRRNGLLLLGHGASSHVLDGTFCLDRAGDYFKAMLRNPDQRRALLRQLKIPTIQAEGEGTAETRQFWLFVINGQITVLEQLTDHSMQVVNDVHESLLDMCLVISEKVGRAPVSVSIRARDISRSLALTGGAVEDFDLAPDLEQLQGLHKEESRLMETVADDLINWLFPDQQTACMPIIAVTGTNGKTTTCRMINHVMQLSGRKPGLVCSDGIYVNEKQLSEGDACSFIGHARVMTSKLADVAVLEAHHRGIALRGFAFSRCDVAVCLNVTSEHLQDGEIESVEQMAVIKRSLLERAGNGVVLFADDANCMAMLEFMKADKVCLVSLRSSVGQLRGLTGQNLMCFCVLEYVGDEQWIILYDKQHRLPVLPVFDIPATFNGTARFNVSNAMHAIAASYLAGIDLEKIGAALGDFSSGYESTPGRLNVYDDLPFRVIIDYAHNADGFQKRSEFIDSQPVSGRKILVFGIASAGRDADIKAAMSELAGHFDHYVCVNPRPSDLQGRTAHELPALLASGLTSAGVAESDISLIFEFDGWWRRGLALAAPGDLLVMIPDTEEVRLIREFIARMANQRGQC